MIDGPITIEMIERDAAAIAVELDALAARVDPNGSGLTVVSARVASYLDRAAAFERSCQPALAESLAALAADVLNQWLFGEAR